MAVTLSGADAAAPVQQRQTLKKLPPPFSPLARTLIYFSRFEILIDTAIEFRFFIIAEGLKGVRLLN
jgi:hypothetical protein